jgi:hypothetical protein
MISGVARAIDTGRTDMSGRGIALAARPPKRLVGALAIASTVLVALAGIGCGSSSKSSTTTAATTTAATTTTATTTTAAALSKPQFLAQANAICTQGNQRIGPAGQALGNHPSTAQIAAFATGTFVPNIQGQIDALRALAAPAADKAAVKTMLDVAQANLNRIKIDPLLLAGSTPPFAEFGKLAHPYGLTACAPSG